MTKQLRITPDPIGPHDLGKHQVFVFGSNEAGIHGGGAARLAMDHFGARLGQGMGFMAQCFAIPTKDWQIDTLPLDVVEMYVKRFIAFTNRTLSNKWEFLVTKIGCGLAGFTVPQIAPLFKDCRDQKNIWLPQDFHDFLDGKYVAPPLMDQVKGVFEEFKSTSPFLPQEEVLRGNSKP